LAARSSASTRLSQRRRFRMEITSTSRRSRRTSPFRA
jgi:hypothetical protein